jgi:hypothetical protein
LRTTLCFSWLILGALLVPAVHAGSAAAPELSDPAGDAPPALDVLAAWWSSADATHATINIHLSDLLVGQPLADTNAAETRWYYTASFSTSAYRNPIVIRCIVGVVESSPAHGITVTGDVGLTYGTDCQATPIPETLRQPAFTVNTAVDKQANTLSITLTERTEANHVDIGPGTSFSGLTLKTGGGKVSTFGVGHEDTTYDTTAAGATFTM